MVSWVVLRGRCASCRTTISPRYPVVELATGILSAWVAWHFGFGTAAACALLVTWALIALTGIDIDHQLLPDRITLPLLWAGLLAAAVLGPLSGAPEAGSLCRCRREMPSSAPRRDTRACGWCITPFD